MDPEKIRIYLENLGSSSFTLQSCNLTNEYNKYFLIHKVSNGLQRATKFHFCYCDFAALHTYIQRISHSHIIADDNSCNLNAVCSSLEWLMPIEGNTDAL
jgi:hypothetical protein